MSAQLAFLFAICTIIKTNAKDPINFKTYLDTWKAAPNIEFKFLTRQQEIDGEIGMYKYNAKAQKRSGGYSKRDYILIPVGSTTSQPIIAEKNKRRIKPIEIELADKFGAKPPYTSMENVKKFAENIREIRKKHFPQNYQTVPVIFLKSISYDLTPTYIKDKAKFKSWCRGEAIQYKGKSYPAEPHPQSAEKITNKKEDGSVMEKPIDNDDTKTYTKLKYYTKPEDNFYIFLPGDCAGVTLTNPNAKNYLGKKYTAKGKVAQMTFAWAQFMAAQAARKGQNVAVGDIGGGGDPHVYAFKKHGTQYDQYEGTAGKYPGEKKANKLYDETIAKCNGKPDSPICKDASKKLAEDFIDSIKKGTKSLKKDGKTITVDQTKVYQTGKIRAAYYKKDGKDGKVAKLVDVWNRRARRNGAHVGLNDYYQYDDEYDEYEYDNANDEYDEDIDTLYYEAVNNLLRAKDNFDVAQQIKQGNEAKKQRNGYYYY